MAFPFRVKLSHKLTGLVIIPLAFEIIFVGLLTGLLKQTEQEAIREKHARLVLSRINGINDLIFDAGTSLVGYTMTRSDEALSKYYDLLVAVMQNLRTVEFLVKDNPAQQKPFQQIQEACSSGIDLLEQYRLENTRSGNMHFSVPVSEWRGRIQVILDKILSSTEELAKEERRVSDVAPLTQSTLREQIMYALTGGIVFNVVLALILSLVLYRGIVKRIGVVVDNTKRIVAREKLLPRVGGADEISRLDGVFHDMADELERVAAHKQELISMVSHDLRSPLMSVQISLELIQSGAIGEVQARVNKEVTVASANVKRLIELINDLLDIEKIEAGRLDMHVTRQQLLPIIDSAIDSVSPSADRKGISIQRPLFDVGVDCDKQRIVQVLVNLLSNAIKFSKANGEIGIEVQDGADEVQIRVRDDGPGIDSKVREKIFERFQQADNDLDRNQTDRAKKGTGLGLAICKAIVAGHDGLIGVDSESGKGSVFWFTLPRRHDLKNQ